MDAPTTVGVQRGIHSPQLLMFLHRSPIAAGVTGRDYTCFMLVISGGNHPKARVRSTFGSVQGGRWAHQQPENTLPWVCKGVRSPQLLMFLHRNPIAAGVTDRDYTWFMLVISGGNHPKVRVRSTLVSVQGGRTKVGAPTTVGVQRGIRSPQLLMFLHRSPIAAGVTDRDYTCFMLVISGGNHPKVRV